MTSYCFPSTGRDIHRDIHAPIVMVEPPQPQTPIKLPPILSEEKHGDTDSVSVESFPSTENIKTLQKIKQIAKMHQKMGNMTRMFVIGNPGAGKSSFIEAMKRESFFDSFRLVSEYSVPRHTAGIVPSIHTSKRYGKVLFYDFAGNPEYYSSHAAILENLVSSEKGDNIFIIVVDMREDSIKITNILQYWLSFILQPIHLKVIVLGSHADLLTSLQLYMRKLKIRQLCNYDIPYLFTLNCCKPRSKQLEEVKSAIVLLTKDSPRYKLSTEAAVLLGVLKQDFGSVTACPAQTILSHIELTALPLPTNLSSLMPVLEALHDFGLLFVIGNKCDDTQVILDISQFTSEVHERLFSMEAREATFSFNVGMLPQYLLDQLLPQHVLPKNVSSSFSTAKKSANMILCP